MKVLGWSAKKDYETQQFLVTIAWESFMNEPDRVVSFEFTFDQIADFLSDIQDADTTVD